MWDRVSDPVSRPKGPRARCGQSMSIAVVYLAIKKLIPLSSSPSPRIVAGNFLHSPRRCSRLLPERVRPQIQPACGGCYAHPRALDLLSSSPHGGSTLCSVEKARFGRRNSSTMSSGPTRPNDRLLHGVEYVCQNPIGVSTEVRVPVDLGRKDSCALGGGAESQRPFRPPDRAKDPVP